MTNVPLLVCQWKRSSTYVTLISVPCWVVPSAKTTWKWALILVFGWIWPVDVSKVYVNEAPEFVILATDGPMSPGRVRTMSASVKDAPLTGWVNTIPLPKVEVAVGVPKLTESALTCPAGASRPIRTLTKTAQPRRATARRLVIITLNSTPGRRTGQGPVHWGWRREDPVSYTHTRRRSRPVSPAPDPQRRLGPGRRSAASPSHPWRRARPGRRSQSPRTTIALSLIHISEPTRLG